MAQDGGAAALETARRTMVDCQVRPSDVTDVALIDAMLETPRELFLPKSRRAVAYIGEHIDLGDGRVELDPRILAKMIDAARPGPDDLAMVLGSGAGYAAAVLSRLCPAVVAVEPSDALRAVAEAGFAAAGADNVISVAAPMAEGCAKHAPYNVVFVNGAVTVDIPEGIKAQLADGGRMSFVRMRGVIGRCEVLRRDGDAFGVRAAFDATAPALPEFVGAQQFVF
ncbi:MAG: protein-L-isoaspartate O-methyltransferase [Pseudomonadota bacterium]